jgi:muramoyltetrapeptide carboxypeptidase
MAPLVPPSSRRTFIRELALAPVLASLVSSATPARSRPILKPPRLAPGNVIGLVNPAGATFEREDIVIAQETLAALGFATKLGRHVLDRRGYFAGTDAERAADINAMFADPSVHALLAVRGGWGCNRILPLLQYDRIREHPKALIGYSDITALLVAIYARSGLVTFHGPVGISTWNAFSVDYFRRVLMDGQAVTFTNPVDTGDNLVQTRDRIETITPGTASGVLVGGNLSVLSAMMGSAYLPDWKSTILFLEETDENVYRVDRMMTQLLLAHVLSGISGFVFGQCTHCTPGEGYGSLTLEEVFDDLIKPLNIPAWSGSMIGHIEKKFTVPIGVPVSIDAAAGSITMNEPAVV